MISKHNTLEKEPKKSTASLPLEPATHPDAYTPPLRTQHRLSATLGKGERHRPREKVPRLHQAAENEAHEEIQPMSTGQDPTSLAEPFH